jgi:hypothetical protein
MYLPKDTAQDRGLNVCKEKRDAVLSVLEEAGKLMQDEDIAKSTVLERIDADVCWVWGELLKWSGESVSYKLYNTEGVSVVETTNAMVDLRECRRGRISAGT